jgi:phosphate transport system permease protein
MGTFVARPTGGLTAPAIVLPTQVFAWFTAAQPGYEEKSAAAIMVLLAVLLVFNTLGFVLRTRLRKPR